MSKKNTVSRVIVTATIAFGLARPVPISAQGNPQPTAPAGQVTEQDGSLRLKLPTITVTAEKEPENIQETPVSVTAVTAATIQSAGISSVSQAAQLAPNTYFNEFTARKLSNPRFRGIGSSPNNPSVTTYIDGVPQLNANSSSLELVDVNQIEFVRGPQGALFGRNTLGGIVNITSASPSLDRWTGSVSGPWGNFKAGDVHATLSGPLMTDTLAIGLGVGYSGREGFTTNTVTGNDLDSRSAGFGKLQLLWRPMANWQVRGILSSEVAHDGDYALQDLDTLNTTHYRSSRTIEGFTRRGIVAPTFIVSRTGATLSITSTTGWVWWKTRDLTDLDYTASPFFSIIRENREKDLQFTEEFRVASAPNASIKLSDRMALRWQAGTFLFTQRYEQDAVNSYSPGLLYQPNQFFPGVPPTASPANSQHSPQSSLDDNGIGVYGRGTLTLMERLDVSVGLRGDYEKKTANLKTFFDTADPFLGTGTALTPEKTFSDVSPQFTIAYRAMPQTTVYATAARGFKAGGFNPASPAGKEAYTEERSWNYEAGAKTSWLNDRVALNGALFYIDWKDLQINLPNALVPGQFFISNAASATSKGFELEANTTPIENLLVFGGVGLTHARFGSSSTSSVGGGTAATQISVDGNKLSNVPESTLNVGLQYTTRPLFNEFSVYGRADVVRYGAFQYDDANTKGQDAYSLTNLRLGLNCGSNLFVEGWVRNAFDTFYVPTAFAYEQTFAPSKFIGESGAARTFGVRAGVSF